jgi:hypothetical protein
MDGQSSVNPHLTKHLLSEGATERQLQMPLMDANPAEFEGFWCCCKAQQCLMDGMTQRQPSLNPSQQPVEISLPWQQANEATHKTLVISGCS